MGRLDLGVLRERLRAREEDRAAVRVDVVRALFGVAEPGDHAVGVAQEQVGRVDEHAVGVGRRDGEAPRDRLGERLDDRAPLGRVLARGAVAVVALHHEHARADALEDYDATGAELPLVEPDRVRSEPGGERDLIEDLGVEARDLEVHPPRARVPVERHEAVDLLHPDGLGRQGRQLRGRVGRLRVLRSFVLSGGARDRPERHQDQRGGRAHGPRHSLTPSSVSRSARRVIAPPGRGFKRSNEAPPASAASPRPPAAGLGCARVTRNVRARAMERDRHESKAERKAESGGERRDDDPSPPAVVRHVEVAIVGSGFGGLGIAIRLKQSGVDDFVVLERAGDVGGTWRDNSYPGCACDVESHL
jgi:hypothetical protein